MIEPASAPDLVDLDHSRLAEVRALILAGLEEHWGSIDDSLNPDLDDLLASYPNGRTILAVHDDVVVGTGTLRPLESDTAEIIRMSVASSFRRSGLGVRLVEELIATARRWGCAVVVLETTSAWTGVVNFYQRCGFEITGVEDSEFGQGTWFERRL